MRRFFALCLLCLWASRSWGQAPTPFPLDPTTHRIRYTGLVPVTGRRQADLLASAQAWAKGISTPDQPAVNTRVSDAERLVVQGTQPFSYTYRYIRPQQAASAPQHYTIRLVLHYTATLSLQDGGYTYDVTDFVVGYPTAQPPSPTQLPAEDDLLNTRPLNERGASMLTAERTSFREAIKQLLAQLQQQMNQPTQQSSTE
jgi:hypothetical protein